nr:MAG TPA: Neck appendage protein [Caudoviricetes sp.]
MQLHFNSTYIDVLPTDESYRYRSIMGEHTLNLYFALPTYTEIPTGAWCEFQGERYTLNQPAKVVKHNSRHFEYTLTMDSEGANLKNYKFRNPNDKTLKFPFTASPRYHIQILVDCLNMIDSGWQIGTTIEANEKLISYNHNNCLEALDMIAKAFETEYEIIGKTIHLHKVEYFKDNPLPLQYGKGKGFKTGVSRTTEQSRITRLYVQGGERNIDRSKYGNKELLLPKSQEYVYEGVTFVSDDKGLSIAIKNAQNNGFINEQSLDLSHIYPSRKGTISAVFEVDRDKHFYDFADTTIPQALNFADLQIKGEKMVIYFDSGMLSGREFEVSKYDHAQKRFQLVPKEEDGTTMPNDIFKPAVGDRYSVYNMHLPAAYICDNDTKTGASWEMMKEACKYLYENRADLFTFTGDLDGIWAKKNWANVGGRLKMGAYIHFSDTEFQRTPIAIRIVGLKEYVNNPYSPQIELSNKVQGQSFSSEIRKLQNQEVYFGEMNKQTQSLTKRSWRNALETIKQVEEAFPEYTKSIIPATVQTMMALVGNKSGQFAFVANKTNPITVPHTLYFDRNNKQINAGSGWIKHYTLGTTDIKPSHSAADYKYWYVSQFVSGRLDDKAKSYYLYIKANKAIETAEFVLSENKIDMEQEAGFYHFLYATVNSEYDGERGIAQFNGFTEITGGQMVTNRIASGNGQQFIALYDDRIEINAHLQISESNKLEFKQLVNPDLQSLESRLKQYSNEQMGNIQVGGRNFVLNSKPRITQTFSSFVPIAWYDLSQNLEIGATYIFTLKNHKTIPRTFLWDTDWPNAREIINGIPFSVSRTYKKLLVHTQNPSYECDFEMLKIEKGNKPTDWSPAPEDLENKIDNERQSREQAVASAKSATESYARAQADLLKLQAIAEANRNAGLAITAEQQARIQEAERNLQAAKTHAEREVNKLNIGARNLVLNSRFEATKFVNLLSGWATSYDDETFGKVVRVFRPIDNGNFQYGFNLASYDYSNKDLIFMLIAKPLTSGKFSFGRWDKTYSALNTASESKPLGNGWRLFWTKVNTPNIGEGVFGLNSLQGDWLFYACGVFESTTLVSWSPAPEDVENQIANINSDLDTIRQNAARIEDLENKNKANTDQRIGKLDQKTAFLNETQIAGNVVATGTMIVGNTLGAKAGITGVGNANNEERFWAGETYDKRKQAPFRVTEDGSIYASKGRIGNFNIESGRETSLLANGLTIASNGIIKAFGGVTNRSTQVIINDPAQLQELVGTRPAASIYSSGFGETAHTALHLTSRGGSYNAALVLEAGNGTNGATAIDVRSGDILVKGKKSFSGTINIGNVKITVTNGIITGAQ